MNVRAPAPPPATLPVTEERDSVGGLLRQLLSDLSVLVHQEMALAIAELSRTLGAMRAAAVSAAIGAAVVFAGLLALLAAAVLGLMRLLAPWLASLLVGAAVSALGLALLAIGRQRLVKRGLMPRHLERSLRGDADAVRRGGGA